MSFNNKPNRPDSRDTARLRAEYEKKAQEFRSTTDPASKAKLKDDKQKLFQRVVEHMNHERADSLSQTHKVLIGMGKLKSESQVAEERAKIEAARREVLAQESRK